MSFAWQWVRYLSAHFKLSPNRRPAQRARALGRKEEPNFAVNLHNAKKEGLVEERVVEGKVRLLSLKIEGLKAVKEKLGETIGVKTWLIESGKVYSGKKLFQEIVISKIGSTAKSARASEWANLCKQMQNQDITLQKLSVQKKSSYRL